MLYACILAAAGLFGDTVLLQAFVRPEALWHPRVASAAPPVHGTGILLMMLIWLAVGPFWLAGIYTTIGEALHDHPVGWKTFWVWGARHYGRGWGLIGYMTLYGVALMVFDMVGGLATFLLGVRDPVVDIGIAVALLIAVLLIGLPWMLRMLGGLFVDRLSWSASWTRSFARKNYGILLGLLLLTAVVGMAAIMLLSLLPAVLGIAGTILFLLADMAVSIVLTTWMMALYIVTASTGQPSE